jgi:hypothetical protein
MFNKLQQLILSKNVNTVTEERAAERLTEEAKRFVIQTQAFYSNVTCRNGG